MSQALHHLAELDLESVWQWLNDQFTPFDEDDALPFGPVECEATPEIPTLF